MSRKSWKTLKQATQIMELWNQKRVLREDHFHNGSIMTKKSLKVKTT